MLTILINLVKYTHLILLIIVFMQFSMLTNIIYNLLYLVYIKVTLYAWY